MEPMTYGEMVADRIQEARRAALREQAATRRNVHATPAIPAWRIASGRLLVSLGERVAGCAELVRTEVNPNINLAG